MANQHAPALLASTENFAEDLTDDEVSFSTDQNIFSFVQEMTKGKVIIYIYIYNLHGNSLARRGGLDPARFSTPLTEPPLRFRTGN